MRLIDADAFAKFIEEKYKDGESTKDIKEQMLFDLDVQPTAYDPEKVVEQLEERYSCDVGALKMIALDTAIEIVKGGYEEVYREEYDTAGNYHAYGTQSGHCMVMKPVIK